MYEAYTPLPAAVAFDDGRPHASRLAAGIVIWTATRHVSRLEIAEVLRAESAD